MTAAKSTLNIKIDNSVKDSAAQILADMGLDRTTAIEGEHRTLMVV